MACDLDFVSISLDECDRNNGDIFHIGQIETHIRLNTVYYSQNVYAKLYFCVKTMTESVFHMTFNSGRPW